MTPPILLGVAGNPILHSLSPQLHAAALGAGGRSVRLAVDSLAEAVEIARDLEMAGLNVTSPFKRETEAVDRLSGTASAAGAVNTVVMGSDAIVGHLTDGDGVVGALRAAGVSLEGPAVVLGAGGAARAAIAALHAHGCPITVINRTPERAREAAAIADADHCGLDDPRVPETMAGATLLVGCLSTAERVLPARVLHAGLTVLEAHYARTTALLDDAGTVGARAIPGHAWLAHQAVAAIRLMADEDCSVSALLGALQAPEETPRHIAVVGMMGAGKDTVARLLAEATGWPVLDCDREAERRAGMPVAEIFARHGEDHFRQLEATLLQGIGAMEPHIVNCGGGAVLDPANRAALGRHSVAVWLWAPPATLAGRVAGRDRPLLRGRRPVDVLAALSRQRRHHYAATAHLLVSTHHHSAHHVSERIIREVDFTHPRLRHS